MPVHKVRIARFINKDPEDWSTVVHDAALSTKSNWHEPPGIYELPGAVVPTWAKIGVYSDAGGLEHVDIHKEPVAPRAKGGRASNVRARMKTPLSFRASVGPPGEGCWFERKGDPCKYHHDPTDKSQEQKEGGGSASGAAHKKPKAGVRTVPSAAASGDGDGSGKGGSSAKSSQG